MTHNKGLKQFSDVTELFELCNLITKGGLQGLMNISKNNLSVDIKQASSFLKLLLYNDENKHD